MLISDRIFELIKEKGMTQKEFSMLTNIPQSTISDWKGKRLNPSSDKLVTICSVLGISPNELLYEAGSGNVENIRVQLTMNEEEQSLLESFRRMDDESKKHIIQYAIRLAEMKK